MADRFAVSVALAVSAFVLGLFVLSTVIQTLVSSVIGLLRWSVLIALALLLGFATYRLTSR